LASEQIAQFVRDGFAQVSGLVPPEIVAATCAALLQEHTEAAASGSAGARSVERYVRLTTLTAPCRTTAMEEAIQELVGPHFLRGVTYSPFLEALGAPPTLYSGFIPVLRDPQPGPRAFEPPEQGYHLDGIHRVSVLPESAYLVVFVYLTDVAEYGGATVVRPGSHRQVFDYWRAQAAPVTNVLPDLPYAPPTPIPGKAGDTLFMHYLLVHSGSANHAEHVRVGLNTSVVPDHAHRYTPRTGAPSADWTPLDYTLAPAAQV
jgi:hypothetical protein